MKITLGTITTDHDIAAGADFINVPWTLFNDDDSIAQEGAQAFPLDATDDEIKAFVQQKIASYRHTLELSKAAEEEKQKRENANSIATNLSGVTFADI